MNRVNYVPGRTVEADDLNAVQATMESHLRSHAQELLAGQIVGLAVSGTAGGLQVGTGFTWDAQGRRIAVSAATAVDVSAVQRPASGQYRWLLVHAAYATANRGTVQDINQAQQVAYIDDAVTLAIAAGPPFAAADIGSARGTAAGRPAAPEGSVALGLLIVDHATAWDTLGDAAARPSQPPPPPSPSQVASSHWQPGDVRPWPGAVVPSGWAACDGVAISRTNHSQLFAAIGTTWGVGDGNTTFNLPNLIGRSLIGAGGTYILGAQGGAAKVTLTTAQMPAHSHGQPAHDHGFRGTAMASGASGVKIGGDQPRAYGYDRDTNLAGGDNTHSAGGGGSHENMSPYAVIQWIIYLGT